MKKFLLFMLFILFEINGAYATTPKFSVTTINMNAGDTFSFGMSAAGTFTVDCGDGGVLSGTGVSGNTIDRTSNNNYASYTCTYSTGGVKTIGFDGLATGYNSVITDAPNAAINFYLGTPQKIVTVSGSLGAIFPTLGQSDNLQPAFYETFRGCTLLTNIPGNLFDGVTGYRAITYSGTFRECTSLTSVPNGLFSGFTGGDWSFSYTFLGDINLLSIPADLFSDVTVASEYMFRMTFRDCVQLKGYILPSMFAGLINNGAQTAVGIWNLTFYATQLDTLCPNGTEQYITGYESAWASESGRAVVSCETGIASTSYVQGMYEAINNSKMAKLNPNSIEFTADSSPYGFFTAVEGAGDKFRFKREEITLPFGSYDNPTGRMSIWLE